MFKKYSSADSSTERHIAKPFVMRCSFLFNCKNVDNFLHK